LTKNGLSEVNCKRKETSYCEKKCLTANLECFSWEKEEGFGKGCVPNSTNVVLSKVSF
jgi:hypothetical protein